MKEVDKKYSYWFAEVPKLSDSKKIQLRKKLKTEKRIYYIEETKLNELEFLSEAEKNQLREAKKGLQIEQIEEYINKEKITCITFFDKEYPKRLKQITSPPYALYIKGKLPAEDRPSIAIVGARECTPYGEQMALSFAKTLALNGVQIISGMARGIDGAGQRGALNAGGESYGVLGSGIDICYPKEHRGLYMDLQKMGGILSEQPLKMPPMRQNFPARNRIISGLSDVILVMEAREKSGSLITADMALEQGKDVYALPGPISSSLSNGCNRLIRQGAGILLSPEELVEELQILLPNTVVNKLKKSDKNKKMLESTENMLYSCLDLYPKSVSVLAEETKLAPARLFNLLIDLELQGYIKETAKNYYVKLK